MDGEVSIDGDAKGDSMEASVNGRRRCTVKRRPSLPGCNLETLINAKEQRFKELGFVKELDWCRMGCLI